MAADAFFSSDDLQISEFAEICSRKTNPQRYPHASHVDEGIVVYDGKLLRNAHSASQLERTIKNELVRCLKDGPGVFVVREAFADVSIVEASTSLLREITASEKVDNLGRGDHFGDNERIWNSMQKVCVAKPALFIEYYGNPIIRLASEAWLGPNYRVTAQMNNVKPGSQAQSPHRDYHLGFQSVERTALYPAHAQTMSQFLTLQGAISHCEMSKDKGPTKLLPFSQLFGAGYMAYELDEFIEFFESHHVQLPLSIGDMLFFNPAVFHAGGNNRTKEDRIANLLQVSSMFGRTMESINNRTMIDAVYPELQKKIQNENSEQLALDVIAVIADGYSFPTNLDYDPPIDGNAPRTQQEMVVDALKSGATLEELTSQLDRYAGRRRA